MRGEGGLTIKNRTSWLSTYPKTFKGCDAVSWLVDKNKATSREEALAICNQMIEADLAHHASDASGFTDDKAWFRFRVDDEANDGMSYYAQARECVRSGALQHKKTFGWENLHVVIKAEPAPCWLQYESAYAAKPSKIISLDQVGLNVAECEDCKKDWHCLTLSGGDKHIHSVYCAHHSRDQQAWIEALIAQGVTLQRENLSTTANSLFEFNAASADGSVVPFSTFAGKVCMVVNVASY